jgi:hypothetical protein
LSDGNEPDNMAKVILAQAIQYQSLDHSIVKGWFLYEIDGYKTSPAKCENAWIFDWYILLIVDKKAAKLQHM